MKSDAELQHPAPLPSATVVLLRDGREGLEIFLLERHGQSDVLGGAYVFPGGKVDRKDPELTGRLDVDAATLHKTLGEPEMDERTAAAVFVAAIREVFEETGVLFADDVGPDRANAAWKSLREGRGFDEVTAGLRLQVGGLVPWSRWVTPIIAGVVRKRFDARFFIARVPGDQVAHHDDHEAVASLWRTPRAALQEYWDNRIALAPPQIMTLAALSRHADAESAMAFARTRPPPRIAPVTWFEPNGDRVACYPGDEGHPERERAMPGPTRLYTRNNRFEPEGGFDALFG
ncbi:NUDIX hydrolase [Ramlibacter sp.]|uniref:NUDIX hydrolase n=1 Tax=Ramlibacter sp. TaxID=1917967 RepID=UPI003D0ECE02